MATILPQAKTQFNDALGVPLAGGRVSFYTPSTTTPKDTYQDAIDLHRCGWLIIRCRFAELYLEKVTPKAILRP